ncbi:MAG: hypothetical protein ACRCWQ_09595 [Bacilli bacterium]
MLSIIGSAFVTVASTIVGVHMATQLKDRVHLLQTFQTFFTLLQSEITYTHVDLASSFIALGKRIAKPVGPLFQQMGKELQRNESDLDEVWRNALFDFGERHALSKDDVDMLVSFGSHLGSYDRENERNQIQRIIDHLQNTEQIAAANERRYGSACTQLGVLAGVGVVILLL